MTTNDLLTSYDVSETVDQPGVVRAVTTTMPAGACTITVERPEPLGELTDLPAPLPEGPTE